MSARMSAGTVVYPLAVIVDSDMRTPYVKSYCNAVTGTAESGILVRKGRTEVVRPIAASKRVSASGPGTVSDLPTATSAAPRKSSATRVLRPACQVRRSP